MTESPDHVKQAAQYIPSLTTKVLKSSHLIAVEKADEVNQLIEHFLMDSFEAILKNPTLDKNRSCRKVQRNLLILPAQNH